MVHYCNSEINSDTIFEVVISSQANAILQFDLFAPPLSIYLDILLSWYSTNTFWDFF